MTERLFYCYKCQQLMTPTNNLNCSLCNSEFIEELHEEEEQENNLNNNNNNQNNSRNRFSRGIGIIRITQSSSIPIHSLFHPHTLFPDMISMINGARTNNQQESFFGNGFVNSNLPDQFQNLFNRVNFGSNNIDDIISQLIDNNKYGSPPTDGDVLSKLERIKADQEFVDQKETCPICFDEYRLEDKIIKLLCSHNFHEACCTTWLKEHSTCPICRTRLPSVDKDFDIRIKKKEEMEKLDREKKREKMKTKQEKKLKGQEKMEKKKEIDIEKEFENEKKREKKKEKGNDKEKRRYRDQKMDKVGEEIKQKPLERKTRGEKEIKIEREKEKNNKHQQNKNNNNENQDQTNQDQITNIQINNKENHRKRNRNEDRNRNRNRSRNRNRNYENIKNSIRFEDIEGGEEIAFLEDVLNENFSIENLFN
ncbi:e3 ubiquitin-protein ligase ring1-like [Anaeramoeba flamelloides]|uniref:E3 ubiquitin-protein ligase ring1-like n=1 Tax=Anaeramoeba flamelloides TaxID=1746091 RepID=A0ABQ8XKS5_9EUKA|nr:e3 ubiquitin-protein ligase ring1-like [Anaeramoeba flamelloides]